MTTQDPIETDPVEIRSLSAVERSAWQARIVREAHAARNAAMGRLLIRFALATVRGARTLASAFRAAFVLRDAMIDAPRQSRPRGRIHFYQ